MSSSADTKEKLQRRKRRKGICTQCADPVVDGKRTCPYHTARNRLRQEIIRTAARVVAALGTPDEAQLRMDLGLLRTEYAGLAMARHRPTRRTTDAATQ